MAEQTSSTVNFDKVSNQSTGKTQLEGHAKALQGAAYQAIGNIHPDEDEAKSWTESGKDLESLGKKETAYAKQRQMAEATIDSGVAKVKTALGYATGNQDMQTQGNVEAEKAQWEFKQATSKNPFAVPVPSVEGVMGKLQSAVGALTGDAEVQKDGNLTAEKAAWKDGV